MPPCYAVMYLSTIAGETRMTGTTPMGLNSRRDKR